MTNHFWVGGYGPGMEGTAGGIGLLEQGADGRLGYLGVVAECESPSFLLRVGDRLYATAEGNARVDAFTIAGAELTAAGSVPSGGGWPCHLGAFGSSLVVSNYHDGSLGVIRGTELVQTLPGEGSGPRPQQDGPHAHASFALDARTLLSVDLGADRVHVHTLDGDGDGDVVTRTGSLALAAGTGPRDIALHASGNILVLGELSCELLVLDSGDGEPRVTASVALPGRMLGDQAAAIAMNGDHIYVGLRGSNRVSVLRFGAEGADGVEPVGWVDCAGQWPRHLVVVDGLLHVANQLSNSVASFALGGDGMPRLIGEPTAVPSPTYLLPVAGPVVAP